MYILIITLFLFLLIYWIHSNDNLSYSADSLWRLKFQYVLEQLRFLSSIINNEMISWRISASLELEQP